MNLLDKIIVITGATGGIGNELSRALAKDGAKLILISKTEDKLQSLVSELEGNGHIYFVHDATHTDKISELVEKIVNSVDHIDVIFNVAGVGVYKTLEEVTLNEWEDSFAINVTTPYFVTKGLLGLLEKSERALVVNIGSGAGKIPMACRSVYCSTKFALRGLTLSLSEEFHGTDVHFVHIALGSTLTDFGPLSIEDKRKENLEGKSYFTPKWVASKFVEIIKSNEVENEVTLYPTDYSESS